MQTFANNRFSRLRRRTIVNRYRRFILQTLTRSGEKTGSVRSAGDRQVEASGRA